MYKICENHVKSTKIHENVAKCKKTNKKIKNLQNLFRVYENVLKFKESHESLRTFQEHLKKNNKMSINIYGNCEKNGDKRKSITFKGNVQNSMMFSTKTKLKH